MDALSAGRTALGGPLSRGVDATRCGPCIADAAGRARRTATRAAGTAWGDARSGEERVSQDGALVIGTRRSLPLLAGLTLSLPPPGSQGYAIRSTTSNGHSSLVIAAEDDVGVLYGVFHLLRLMQTRQPLDRLELQERPAVQLRVLDHWDNLDRSVERGYAGQSIWDWHKLPDYIDPRYVDYARANASLGINATVLTNVNANAVSLRPDYLEKAAALANVLRPYGIRVFLTVRFAAPIEIGGLQHGRSSGSGRQAVVAGQGRRDLPLDSRLRRLPRQGELRRSARAAGLRALACRRREHARRRGRAASAAS